MAQPTVRSKNTQNLSRVREFTLGSISSTHSSISFSVLFCLSLPDLEWLWNQDASRDLLLAIHPPNYIVLWNGDTGTKLWKKSYAENILSFSFDPFDPSNMARKWFSPLFQMFYKHPKMLIAIFLLVQYYVWFVFNNKQRHIGKKKVCCHGVNCARFAQRSCYYSFLLIKMFLKMPFWTLKDTV